MTDGTLTLITAPTVEPVTVEQAKAHLRVDTNVDDDLISALVTAARGHIEAKTRRQLVEATWELVMHGFPACRQIEVPKPPLLSVSSVKYLDTAGVEQTMSSALYRVEAFAGARAEPGVISLAYGESWPTVRAIERSVRVRYVAGYLASGVGVTAEDLQAAVPAELRQAQLLLVGEMYARRTVATTGTIVVPNLFAVDALCTPFRMIEFAT